MKTEKNILMDEKGISTLIGILLLLAIVVIFLGILQSKSVPEWNKEIEAEHFNKLHTDILNLRQAIEKTASYYLPKTIVVHSSLDYPTRMFLRNPPKPGVTMSTYNDKQIRIRYNGNTTEQINSCTIQIKENYNYFSAPELIIEHGMIIGNNGHANYTMDDSLMNNETIDLYLVECANNSLGTTSSINLDLFPVRISNQSVNNASITFTTDYPELWETYLKSINVNSTLIGNEITMNYNNSTRIKTFIASIDIDLTPTPPETVTPAATPAPTVTVTPAVTPTPSPTTAISRKYTIDADFNEGILTGTNHDIVHDQLQINITDMIGVTFPYIWVPNLNDGTISKVDTRTGSESGRYRVAGPNSSGGGNPSRTTVDLKGNVWVGTRQAGTVVKIGLYEAGACIDRNGNGVIDTSRDTNNNGIIQGPELLPWGQDECVLYEVVLIHDKLGTFVPGTYRGTYDTSELGVAPRGLAIDANNNLWAGTFSTGKYYYIDGATGHINKTLDVSPWGHAAYGAIIDKKGILWSANLRDHVLRINTSNLTDIRKIIINNTYGMCLDYSDHLFIAGSHISGVDARLVKVNINGTNPAIMWNKPARTYRGCVSTLDNNIWVAGINKNSSGSYNSVSRYNNNGTLIATISGFNQPSGVAVDEAGKVWVTDIGSDNIYRIDPATNTVDMTKNIAGSGGHYTYSDMTGFMVRTITTKLGTWSVVFDSGTANISWGTISWNSSEPAGTSVKVNVRTSNDKANWSTWKNAANGVQLDPMLNGRYVEIETTLQILAGDTSPILYDLTVRSIP